MTDYIPYTADEYAPDGPGTALHFERWFRNWEAGFEGAAGAPRLQFAALDGWFTTAGAVGSLCFARRTSGSTDIAFGSTIAGSSLSPVSAVTSDGSSTGDAKGGATTGSALTGTWRCLGNYDHAFGTSGSGTAFSGATLFIRIA